MWKVWKISKYVLALLLYEKTYKITSKKRLGSRKVEATPKAPYKFYISYGYVYMRIFWLRENPFVFPVNCVIAERINSMARWKKRPGHIRCLRTGKEGEIKRSFAHIQLYYTRVLKKKVWKKGPRVWVEKIVFPQENEIKCENNRKKKQTNICVTKRALMLNRKKYSW